VHESVAEEGEREKKKNGKGKEKWKKRKKGKEREIRSADFTAATVASRARAPVGRGAAVVGTRRAE